MAPRILTTIRLSSSEVPHTERRKRTILVLGGCLAILTVVPQMGAQTVSTVHEEEFRSRWTDYQVDKNRKKDQADADTSAGPEDFIAKFTQFGPLEFHGGLSTGWEYSNESNQINQQGNPSHNSFFVAPSLLVNYEKEIGTWNLSARYSVGWLYYLDPNYVGSNGDVTTSQTADLSLLRMNDKVTIRSATSASSGSGFDIERGQTTDRVAAGESFSVEYQLSDYLRTGVSGTFGYDSYSSPGNAQTVNDSTNYRYAGAFFVDNFWTEKTAYRLEISAGGDSQDNGGNKRDRTYQQGVFRVNYGPTAKLAFTGSVGAGNVNDSLKSSNSKNGLRTVYSLSSTYTPSEKTSVTLYGGVEGSSSEPEFRLDINWHPREFTFFQLSVYQQTGLSLTNTDERQSKGFLVSARQRFFGRVDTSLSGGYEENASIIDGSPVTTEDPYYFVALALGWQMNQYLTLQTQIRTSSRRNTFNTTESGEQIRSSLSLSLTF